MFGPSSSPYKVNYSGTESAVVLQCLIISTSIINNVGNESHVDKQGTEFFQTTSSNESFPSKAIARKITLSKSARFYFEQLIDFS